MSDEAAESKRYSLKLKSIPVKIEDKDGVERDYTIREMNGTDRDSYLNTLSTRARLDHSGKPIGIKDNMGAMADVLTRSVYDDTGTKVTKATVQEWPSSLQIDLAMEAIKLSGLDRVVGDTEKKVLPESD